MSKKNSFHITFNAPFTITFCLISLAVFLLDFFIFKNHMIEAAFTCKAHSGKAPFNFTTPLDYITILTHCFGTTDIISLLINMVLLLIMGPAVEERYGSPLLILMSFIAVLLTGVLTACISSTPVTGAASLVLLFIFLSSIQAFQKKQLQFSWMLVIAFYIAKDIIKGPFGKDFLDLLMPILINLLAGIAGSLFGFLSAPKKKQETEKKEKPSLLKKATKIKENENSSSPQSDETVMLDL